MTIDTDKAKAAMRTGYAGAVAAGFTATARAMAETYRWVFGEPMQSPPPQKPRITSDTP